MLGRLLGVGGFAPCCCASDVMLRMLASDMTTRFLVPAGHPVTILAPAAATWSIFSWVDGLLHVMNVALPYSATGWMNWQYILRSVWEWQPHDVPANAFTVCFTVDLAGSWFILTWS